MCARFTPNREDETEGPLVVALAYDGLCTFEFGIVTEVFSLNRPEMGRSWYRFASTAIEKGPLLAQGGLKVSVDAPPEVLDEADLIVIPGWKGVGIAVPDVLCARLRAAHARGARIASICSGTFVLAASGLLGGKVATTHWRYAEALRNAYPDIEVDDRCLYRQEGRIFTSAGSAAGIDLMIEIVRQDFGAAAANSVARRLVMPAHRGGGQAQFLERPVAQRPGTGVAPVMEAVAADLRRDWTIASMARAAGMSLRSFQRHFKATTGVGPKEWVTQSRIEAAKTLLTDGHQAIEWVADVVGFANAFSFRRQFRAHVGVTPTEYRSRFFRESKRDL